LALSKIYMKNLIYLNKKILCEYKLNLKNSAIDADIYTNSKRAGKNKHSLNLILLLLN